MSTISTLTIEQALAIQTQQLLRWSAKLNEETYRATERELTRQTEYAIEHSTDLPENQRGYEIPRGTDIAQIVHDL
jgi:hypothetical protein